MSDSESIADTLTKNLLEHQKYGRRWRMVGWLTIVLTALGGLATMLLQIQEFQKLFRDNIKGIYLAFSGAISFLGAWLNQLGINAKIGHHSKFAKFFKSMQHCIAGGFMTENDVRQSLINLPDDPDEAYRKLLEGIRRSQAPDNRPTGNA